MGSAQLISKLNVLLVEDNPGDVRLAEEALRESGYTGSLFVARDGVEAVDFLNNRGQFEGVPRPDIILLDLNLPRMSGREVLETVKEDGHLRTIPIIILTTSEADHDILNAYRLHANCFVTKPVDLDQFMDVLKALMVFWCNVVRLPPQKADSV